jgi:hypothetical protein
MAKRSKPPTTERLVSDLATLANNLKFAFGVSIKPTANRTLVLQARYAFALADIAEFLERSGVEGDIARKFVELADAIGALRNGVVTDPVRPAKAGGRGPDVHTIWGLRHDVCLARECFVRAGQGRDKAAEEIAKRHPVFDRLKRNARSTLKGSILSWRKRISNADVPAGDKRLAREREFLEARRNLSREEWRAVGEELLREAARITVLVTI